MQVPANDFMKAPPSDREMVELLDDITSELHFHGLNEKHPLMRQIQQAVQRIKQNTAS